MYADCTELVKSCTLSGVWYAELCITCGRPCRESEGVLRKALGKRAQGITHGRHGALEEECARDALTRAFMALVEAATPDDTDLYCEVSQGVQWCGILNIEDHRHLCCGMRGKGLGHQEEFVHTGALDP